MSDRVFDVRVCDREEVLACYDAQRLPEPGAALPLTRAVWDEFHGQQPPSQRDVLWLSVEQETEAVSALVAVPEALECLQGHFPGQPLLPGVMQLLWAEELLGRWRPECLVSGVQRLKFRVPVEPPAILRFVLEGTAGTIAARVERAEERIADWKFSCDGTA